MKNTQTNKRHSLFRIMLLMAVIVFSLAAAPCFGLGSKDSGGEANSSPTLQERFFDFLFNTGGGKSDDSKTKVSKSEDSKADDTKDSNKTSIVSLIKGLFSGGGKSKVSDGSTTDKGSSGGTAQTNSGSAEGDFEFERTDDRGRTRDDGTQIVITKYVGTANTITIPSRIQGLPVTGIYLDAFWGNHLTSVTIPDSVTSIWPDAFKDNPLTSITIGANVELAGIYTAFTESFDKTYNDGGKRAGTYTRPNADSETWTRR